MIIAGAHRTWTIAIACCFLAFSGRSQGDTKPEVKSVVPLGIRSSRTTTVLIYGENLAPKSVSVVKSACSARLIAVKPTDEKTKAKGNTVVSIDVSVPASQPSVNVEIQLQLSDNKTTSATVAIVDDAAEEVTLKKPASTYATAMQITSKSVAVTGTLDGDTADLLKFDARVGETWSVSLLCGRGGSLLDPVLRLRDVGHNTLMISAGDKKRDRILKFRAPANATYFIDITEAEARGGPGYDYRLTVICR